MPQIEHINGYVLPAIYISKAYSPYYVCPDGGSGPCEELSISIQAISNSIIRVTFSEPVINNFALINTENYIFTPSLIISSVTPENSINPSYVDLEVIGMIAQTYQLNILTIEAY